VAGLVSATVLLFHYEQWTSGEFSLAMVFYVAVAGMLVWMLGASARRRTFSHLPVAEGRVVAIVPAYNESPELLNACIESLLMQTVPLDEIVVVDDGSEEAVTPFYHPRITWIRQSNQGKRHAQINGLQGREWADFIVTVDSDSVVAPDGVEHLLRAMSDDRVQAATGACIVRNRAQNLLLRVVDLEINLGNLVMRRARSAVGAVAPTSGPLAIYRSEIVFDNAEEYLTDGTYGDDRRLTHYSLLRGQVVAVDEAWVEFEMPATYKATFRQRTRWFKGYFRYLRWELQNFTGWPLYLRCWNLMLVSLYPLIVAWAFVVYPLSGGTFYWQAIAYWGVLLYVQTWHYVMDRPQLGLGPRLATWLFLTPLLVPYQTLLIRPSMYYAITQVRNMGWATRGAEVAPKHRRRQRPRRGRYRLAA